MKQVIGSFYVKDEKQTSMNVVVVQEEEIDHKGKLISARKIYLLYDSNGEQLSVGQSPGIFLRKNGEILKKTGLIKTNNLNEIL